MLDKKELNRVKKAVKNMKTEKDMFYISGEHFSCRWNGKCFEWKTPTGNIIDCTAKEVVSWIADGKHIENYAFDYDAE